MNVELVKQVLQAFEQDHVQYVVFGGVALNLLGLARATDALDVFIAPDPQNIQQLRTALHRVFDDPNIEQSTAEDLLGEYPAVQYIPPEGSFHIDILLWREPGDPALWEAIASVWDFAARTCQLSFPPGVYKHRSLEDAQRLRDQWEEANFTAYWQRQEQAARRREP